MSPLATLLSLDELYLAGQNVAAGLYRDVESGREICLEQPDYLPASLDGRVAVYACVEYRWSQLQMQTVPEPGSVTRLRGMGVAKTGFLARRHGTA